MKKMKVAAGANSLVFQSNRVTTVGFNMPNSEALDAAAAAVEAARLGVGVLAWWWRWWTGTTRDTTPQETGVPTAPTRGSLTDLALARSTAERL